VELNLSIKHALQSSSLLFTPSNSRGGTRVRQVVREMVFIYRIAEADGDMVSDS